LCGGIIQEATAALERAEAREAEEVGVWLKETTLNKLIDLASKVEGQTEEVELGLLIKLGEEIEYRRDNVASNPRMLKGNLHEELGERAQIAFDESVDAAKVGQQKLNAIRARLDFHSVDSEASSYVGRQPARDREVAPVGRPPVSTAGPRGEGSIFRSGQAEEALAGGGQVGLADLVAVMRGWGQLKANDNRWPVFYCNFVNYPRFKKEWIAYRETYHSIVNDDLAVKTLRGKCVKEDAGKMLCHLEDQKEIWDTLDTCYERPKKYMEEALKPILEFRKYRVYDNGAVREFYSILCAALKEPEPLAGWNCWSMTRWSPRSGERCRLLIGRSGPPSGQIGPKEIWVQPLRCMLKRSGRMLLTWQQLSPTDGKRVEAKQTRGTRRSRRGEGHWGRDPLRLLGRPARSLGWLTL
jgi:hypothetical protein